MTKANAKTGAPSAPESVDVPLSPEAQTGPFFRRVDWAAFWTVFAVTLAAYAYTQAPTVTLEDSGELAVGSAYMGVPHPPGYPIWTLATWFFQWVFKFQTMHGHPNPAWGVAFCSVFFGALACGTLGMLISRSGADLLRSIRRFDEVLGASTESLFCWAGGVSGGLLLAFSPVLWSQSVIVEVYALNGFFQMILMLLLYRWMCRPKENSTLYAMTFLFGLGLANHQTLMFLGLALAVAVLLRAPELFRDFLLVGGALLALLVANVMFGKAGRPDLCWLSGPGSPAFWVYSLLAVAIPIAGAWILPNGKAVCWSFLAVELGAAFYLFMPISSEQNPAINWGYPRTWEGFLHAISRGQYERINPANIFTSTFIDQVFSYLSTLRSQFTLPVLLAGFLPLCVWKVRLGGRQLRAFHLALLFTAGAVVMVFLEHAIDIPGQPDPAFIHIGYKVMTFGIMLLAAIGVAALLMDAVGLMIRMGRSEKVLSAVVGVGLLAGLTLGVAFIYFQLFKALFGADVPGLMRLVLLVGMAVPPATIAALFLLRKEPFAFDFEFGPAAQRWLLTTVIGFVSVTFIFIAVLNPQLDVQTMFIGRVEFVQTHSLFALWLGYGVLFTLAMIETLAGGRKFFRWPTAIFALALPLVLIWKNGYDQEFIRIFGGSEMTGHEFGWQFGNWELRGVNGIKEDLQYEKDFDQKWAAYPPNKAYPPEMGTNAIFFGGTDPGRFVPTYMIYDAKVRSDVYLITQNALADNTYLNVMRDLYGDTIWIPSIQDSNLAFQQYVSDVRGGRINPGAEVDMKDGRISVQGVAGVMHINGILARMIFEANKDKHEFYVEESYVIPWMYDFMEPCGLILKLNGQPTPLTDTMVKNDRDFWDWYAKRLLGDTKFLRDVVARKTFSKLPSAIAVLYAARGRFPDAEYAFQQSIDLYPLSPEANFRLADIFVAEGKYDQSRKLIEEFLRGDPKNDKVREFIKHVDDVEKVTKRRMELEQMAASGRLDLTAAMELVDLCRKTQQWPRFEAMVRGLLTQPQPLPPPAYLQLGQMCGEVGRLDLLDLLLVKYISVQPADTRIRVELAAVRIAQQNLEGTLAAVREAVEKGGETARNLFRGDPRFDPIRGRPEFQQLVPPAAATPFQIPGKLQDMFR